MLLVLGGGIFVSIPFKREGLSEPKAETDAINANHVSIPFKREGLSEHQFV